MAFTFFFRDEHTLRQLAHHLAPTVIGRSRVAIWDAGCAMGQEPYTLAIILAEVMGPYAFRNLKILATDHNENENFGTIIAAGEYPEAELQRIPEEILARYFVPGAPGMRRVIPLVRDRVVFQKHDLLSLQPVGDGFSLVLCKNVLLHFDQQQRIAVLRMFHTALAPEGFLVMEQTQKLPPELSGLFTQVVSDAQLFRKNS